MVDKKDSSMPTPKHPPKPIKRCLNVSVQHGHGFSPMPDIWAPTFSAVSWLLDALSPSANQDIAGLLQLQVGLLLLLLYYYY